MLQAVVRIKAVLTNTKAKEKHKKEVFNFNLFKKFNLQGFLLQDEMYKRAVPTGGREGAPLGKQQAHGGQGKDQQGLAE